MKCEDCRYYGVDLKEPCLECKENANFVSCPEAPKGTVAKWKKERNQGVYKDWFRCSFCGRAVSVEDVSQLSNICRCGATMKR